MICLLNSSRWCFDSYDDYEVGDDDDGDDDDDNECVQRVL